MIMGQLSRDLVNGDIMSSEELIHSIYSMAVLPLPQLDLLREKFMYDITPFSAAMNSASHKAAFGEEDSVDTIHDIAKKGGRLKVI